MKSTIIGMAVALGVALPSSLSDFPVNGGRLC